MFTFILTAHAICTNTQLPIDIILSVLAFSLFHHLLLRLSSVSPLTVWTWAHWSLTWSGRLQQDKTKGKRTLPSNSSPSPGSARKHTQSPLQLCTISTEVSCQEQIHKPRTKRRNGCPGLSKEPSISEKSLSTEQTSSDISPEHFPSNLTICSWGISWGRGQSFVFNSPHLISDPAPLPFEPAQTFGSEEVHSLATSCVREALCACLPWALPSAGVVPSGPCIGTGGE